MLRFVIVDGARFESPWRANRGVVLSFPTTFRAVWMVAIVVQRVWVLCGRLVYLFGHITFLSWPFRVVLYTQWQSHAADTKIPVFARDSCVCQKRYARIRGLLDLDVGLPSSHWTVRSSSIDIESSSTTQKGSSRLVSLPVTPPSTFFCTSWF